MNEEEFERLIRMEREKPIPGCPPDLESKALRRARLARAEDAEESGLDWLLGIFYQTRYAAAAIVAVLVLSAAASAVAASAYEMRTERWKSASSALDFRVFHESNILRLDQ